MKLRLILVIIMVMVFITGCGSNNSLSNTTNKSDSNDYITVGTAEEKGFIIDNVFHSEMQGDIHFSSFYPNDYDENKEYAIYFALPGWEGLYF